MTENTQNQEVKEEAGCCQGKCAEEGQACGCEGKEACTGEEAKQPETPEPEEPEQEQTIWDRFLALFQG